MKKTIYNFFRLNNAGRTIAKKVLTSPVVANNPGYKKIYINFINKKAKKLSELVPGEIHIETTNSCNARCLMCPRSVGKTRPTGTMEMDFFYKIIENCEKIGKKEIFLSLFGEPLVDPYFFQRLEYVKKRGFKVSFSTNGSLLDKEKAKKLIDLKCDKVTFSIDGFSPQVYESIRVGLSRDEVYNNVNYLLGLKESLKSDLPKIDILWILMDKNNEEVKKFLNYWRSRAGIENVLIASLRNWAGILDKERIGNFGELSKKNIWKPPCNQLWIGLSILWDGRVAMCCDDTAEARIIIGDLKHQTIEDVWQGEILKNLRKEHLEGKQNDISVCKDCPRITVWW